MSSTVFILWLKPLTKSSQDDDKTLFFSIAICDVRVVVTSGVMQHFLTRSSCLGIWQRMIETVKTHSGGQTRPDQ